MTKSPVINRALSRAAANLVAVAAITAIFGLKAYIDGQARAAGFVESPTTNIAVYDPYLTEQP